MKGSEVMEPGLPSFGCSKVVQKYSEFLKLKKGT